MPDPDSLRVAADLCDDHGFTEAAEVLRRFASAEADESVAARIVNDGDPERDHSEADGELYKLLHSLGFTKTCDAYDQISKWYA